MIRLRRFRMGSFHLSLLLVVPLAAVVQLCNKDLFATDIQQGFSSHPEYERNTYPPNLSCRWNLTADVDRKINLVISNLQIEGSPPECKYDYLEILEETDLRGRFCGQLDEHLIVSKSNHISVVFKSDASHEEKGFTIKYSLENACNRTITGGYGTITSPGYPGDYPNEADCWTIVNVSNPEDITELIFIQMVMEISGDCKSDFVEVFTGLSPDSESSIGRFCGRQDEKDYYHISGSSFVIHFHSDHSVTEQGFRLDYDIIRKIKEPKPNCTNQEVKPSESLRPYGKKMEEGDSHLLHCGSNDSNTDVKWMKDLTVLTKYQMSLPGLELLPNHTLAITHMSWKLEGRYTCIILKHGGIDAYDASIKLKNSTKSNVCNLRIEHVPQDKVLMENSFTFLRCSALNAMVTWEKDGVPLRNNINTNVSLLPGLLLIAKASQKDSGTYSCIITHDTLGCSVRKNASVYVDQQIQKTCGQVGVYGSKPCKREGKLVGGQLAEKGSAPWQVMLWKDTSVCSGSLVTAEWVITAAHCIRDYIGHNQTHKNLFIKLGKHDRMKTEHHERIASVHAIIAHPSYDKNPDRFNNDIALIRLKTPVTFSHYISPICLGSKRHLDSLLKEQRIVGKVTGWGQVIYQSASARYLKEIWVPVVRDNVCNASIDFKMTENMFCAGYAEQVMEDACPGDSGGPFAIQENDRWFLVGIVSWGKGCGQQGQFGFYTRMAKYYDWIKGYIENDNTV